MHLRRLLVAVLTAALLVACSDSDDGSDAEEPTPTPTGPASTGKPTPTSEETPEPRPVHPVSLPALMERDPNGGRLRLGAEGFSTAAFTEHEVTYRSGDLRISGRLYVPRGRGPFPALVLAHGYIDPSIYVLGQGLNREQDWLANAGFVVLHVDYRNHALSDDDPHADIEMRLGYTEDVINAVHALRAWDGPVDDERIGLLGRSMGGGVVYNVLTVAPGLVDAGVVFAPVSSRAIDNFNRWIRPDPGRSTLATRILRRYGEPRESPRFWRQLSPRTYFDRITEPVLVHHGTSDDTCPLPWTRATVAAMQAAGVDVRLRLYEGEEHAFGPQWPLSMRRTTAFFRRHLR